MYFWFRQSFLASAVVRRQKRRDLLLPKLMLNSQRQHQTSGMRTQFVLPPSITPTANQSPVLELQWEMFTYCLMADVSVERESVAYVGQTEPKVGSALPSRLELRFVSFNLALQLRNDARIVILYKPYCGKEWEHGIVALCNAVRPYTVRLAR